MTRILKFCIVCGQPFLTLWDKKCERCQNKHIKIYVMKKSERNDKY